MLLRTLYDEKLAQASYLIGCQATSEVLVVDPNRDVERYVRAARKEGMRITHVTETHIHADFVSGTRELAHQTGATMVLSAHGGPDWSYGFANDANVLLVKDGDEFNIGNIRIRVMHTPGHTPEHIAFLVTDTPVTDQPIGIVSGDFVFVGDVGRPDLLEKAAGVAGTMQDGARLLYGSMQRFRELPDYLQVWPGHGAGSACGKALGAVPQSTVGYEKMFSTPFSFRSEGEFVDYVLEGQPDPPRYFAHMKRINRDGPPILGGMPKPDVLTGAQIRELIAQGKTVVDTRHSGAFGRAHIPGSINIPYNKSFTNWAGWLLPYDSEFALIVDERNGTTVLPDIVRDLVLIGLENIAGYATADVVAEGETETLPAVPTSEIETLQADGRNYVLDVRAHNEWEEGHIPGVPNIPIGHVAERANELPRDKRIVVHCQSGSRSAIAASVLLALGFDVVNVRGGFPEWEARNTRIASESAE